MLGHNQVLLANLVALTPLIINIQVFVVILTAEFGPHPGIEYTFKEFVVGLIFEDH